ncbi:hypothetical protein DH2020_016945 [Rehmannia glutinosa]|uniref:Uncharacterized protein n=1 Tax=Rehmannia glutinosa TaxID=99300 RepID=A0ABR0WQE3_REHGL
METPGKHVQKGVLETPMKDKEVLKPEFSSSQSLQDPLDTGRKDPDQMISMRKEDFEKLVMERSQQLANERERERRIPDPDPITGLTRDHDVHKRMGKKGVPGGLEQENEAESRTPPPRPRSLEKVGLGVEGTRATSTIGRQLARAQQDPVRRSRSRSPERNKQAGGPTNGDSRERDLLLPQRPNCFHLKDEGGSFNKGTSDFKVQGEPVHDARSGEEVSQQSERNKQGRRTRERYDQAPPTGKIFYLERG